MPVTAPREPGTHAYTAVLVTPLPDNSERQETTAEFSFRTIEHPIILNVWDVPPAIEARKSFTLKLGVRCVAGCRLAGHAVSVVDEDGRQAGAAGLGDEVWPGTSALYFATLA